MAYVLLGNAAWGERDEMLNIQAAQFLKNQLSA
jgi:hypothetical protein